MPWVNQAYQEKPATVVLHLPRQEKRLNPVARINLTLKTLLILRVKLFNCERKLTENPVHTLDLNSITTAKEQPDDHQQEEG